MKKLMALLLAVAMVASLTACGSKAEDASAGKRYYHICNQC